MPGGLMQLVAYGAQDVHLTGNPNMSFFEKKDRKRYGNFACENIEIPFKESSKKCTCNTPISNNFCPNCGISLNVENIESPFNEITTIKIPRKGDLMYKTYIKLKIVGDDNNFIEDLGENIIKKFQIFIGGKLISSYDNDYMKIHNYINKKGDDYNLYKSLIQLDDGHLVIPLLFWFCKEPENALPLIALQYHEIEIKLEFESLENIYNGKKEIQISGSLMIDYIFLDTDERRRFAQQSHKYLIEQVQVNEYPIKELNESYKIIFNHPCKELFWVIKKDNEYINNLTNVNIQLNGQDRIKQDPIYYNKIQPYQYNRRSMKGLYSYSFSLNPKDNLQPSGSCNFSRIDNSQIVCKHKQIDNSRIKIYGINHNVLKIISGMGALAYSN